MSDVFSKAFWGKIRDEQRLWNHALPLSYKDFAMAITPDEIVSRLDDHETKISNLRADVNEIQKTLGNVATKDDITRISTKIDDSINGILRDALNAQPLKASAIWGAVLCVITLASVIVAIVMH